jgi:hypothetical protein
MGRCRCLPAGPNLTMITIDQPFLAALGQRLERTVSWTITILRGFATWPLGIRPWKQPYESWDCDDPQR